MTVERKAEKRSLYCDLDKDAEKEADTMDDWDEDKLKQVVEKKQGSGGHRPTTDIVSNFYLKYILYLLNFINTHRCNYFALDMQTFFRSCRKIQIRLVLGVSIWTQVHLSSCITTWFCFEKRYEEGRKEK